MTTPALQLYEAAMEQPNPSPALMAALERCAAYIQAVVSEVPTPSRDAGLGLSSSERAALRRVRGIPRGSIPTELLARDLGYAIVRLRHRHKNEWRKYALVRPQRGIRAAVDEALVFSKWEDLTTWLATREA